MVTPDSLDELDRRVYDLAIQPIPLAEIAVRLSVPVAQAAERIERVCARLGVADRAGLRDWTPTNEADQAAEDLTQAEPQAEALRVRRHGRRAVIAAGGVGALAAVGGAIAWRYGRGSSDSNAPSPRATAVPETTVADPEFLNRVPFAETWEVTTFPKGELIDWPHGLFLMGVAGGEVRAHRLRATDAFNYRTWPNGRFVAAHTLSDQGVPTTYLMDILDTGLSWSWTDLQLQLLAVAGGLPDATLVFERRDSNKGTGELIFVRAGRPGTALQPFAAATVAATGFTTPVLVSRDGSAIAVVSSGSARLVITIFESVSGETRATYDPGLSATSTDVAFALDAMQNLDAENSFLLAWHLYQAARGQWMRGFSMKLRWDGGGVTAPTSHDNAATFSANGRYYLREIALRDAAEGFADGPREYWPAVEIVETETGKVLQRIRSAAIYYGDGGPSNRWCNDSWFVALLRSVSAEDGWDVARFVPSPKREGWEVLERYNVPSDPAFAKTWFQSPWVQGVVPAPDNPELVAFGRFAALNLRDGQVVKANVRAEAGPAHIDPWAAGPNWLAFAFPHLGHGGASPPVLLPPKFEPGDAPIETVLRFKVSAQGDTLNLRDQPSLTGTVLASLQDGSALMQAESAARPAGRRGLEQSTDGTWVYVRTPGGIEGWVNSTYLAWA